MNYVNGTYYSEELDLLVRITGPEFVIIGERAAELSDADLLTLVRGDDVDGFEAV